MGTRQREPVSVAQLIPLVVWENKKMAIANDRATALGEVTNDLGQAGIIFNDAVRLSNGGLWSQPATTTTSRTTPANTKLTSAW